jgi:hypothetical protein
MKPFHRNYRKAAADRAAGKRSEGTEYEGGGHSENVCHDARAVAFEPARNKTARQRAPAHFIFSLLARRYL